MADEAQVGGGFKDAEIAKALGAHARTVERVGSGVSQSASKLRSPTRVRNGAATRIGGEGEARFAVSLKRCSPIDRRALDAADSGR